MQIQLPDDQGVDVGTLAGLFQNMNQSYKLFWFKAIVEKVCDEKTVLSYDELVNSMIADAWYMVLEYRLSLGAGNTRLVEVVKQAGVVSKLKASEKKEKILKFLKETGDKEIIAGKRELVENVPYRLLRPFRIIFEECKRFHINDERIREGLYQPGKQEEEFGNELREILFPLYESAKKAGFSDGWIWKG